MKKLETYFIRHTWECSTDKQTREQMWKQKRIFIHFPWDKIRRKQKYQNRQSDATSTNPQDYEGFDRRAVRAFKNLADNGGYVAAAFAEHPELMMLGKVEPQKIKLVKSKRRPDYPEKPPKNHSGIEIIKTLHLSKCRFIALVDYALLQTVQPRQGTIMRWHKAKNLVEALVLRRRLKPAFDLLDDEHQEELCAEFLRRPLAAKFGLPQLDCLLCDVGRTMKDLDIFGLATDGKKIFGQVTHDTFEQAAWKLAALKKYKIGRRSHLILFCDLETQKYQEGILIFPIREIYKSFTGTPTGKRWLKNIFAIFK